MKVVGDHMNSRTMVDSQTTELVLGNTYNQVDGKDKVINAFLQSVSPSSSVNNLLDMDGLSLLGRLTNERAVICTLITNSSLFRARDGYRSTTGQANKKFLKYISKIIFLI